jgi:hypothetical protein
MLILKNTAVSNWNGNLDSRGRFSCFIVSDAQRKLAKTYGDRGAKLLMEPLIKLLKQDTAKTGALARWCIKTMTKVYIDLNQDKAK